MARPVRAWCDPALRARRHSPRRSLSGTRPSRSSVIGVTRVRRGSRIERDRRASSVYSRRLSPVRRGHRDHHRRRFRRGVGFDVLAPGADSVATLGQELFAPNGASVGAYCVQIFDCPTGATAARPVDRGGDLLDDGQALLTVRARARSSSRSRALRVSAAARSNSARASSGPAELRAADRRGRSAAGGSSAAPARRSARRRARGPPPGRTPSRRATARFSSTTGDGASRASSS